MYIKHKMYYMYSISCNLICSDKPTSFLRLLKTLLIFSTKSVRLSTCCCILNDVFFYLFINSSNWLVIPDSPFESYPKKLTAHIVHVSGSWNLNNHIVMQQQLQQSHDHAVAHSSFGIMFTHEYNSFVMHFQ